MIFFHLLFASLLFSDTDKDDHILIFPAYGYEAEDEWIIPVRVYVYEYRNRTERVVTRIVRRIQRLTPEQTGIFRSRARYFVVDSESRVRVRLMFDDDPQEQIFRIRDRNGDEQRTGLNGFIRGQIHLSKDRAEELLEAQQSDDGWLSIRTATSRNTGRGNVQLIPETGISVISDIDDTIKVTEIPAGSSYMVRNTFFKEFTAAPGMAEMYQNLPATAFHYVSGSPWQLFIPLNEFVTGENGGFPPGTFHMKTATKNFLSPNTWRNLHNLAFNENITFDQKVAQISTIFRHFPNRQFIMIGDSGEADPEVFRAIRNRFPDQVAEIHIRDVVNARELNPQRLEGMIVIPAPTIERGKSQFWQ